MSDDPQLLRRYVEGKSEAAFRKLAERHLDMVYSAALRQLGGDSHRAQDVVQMVFATLAGKAAALTSHPTLVGWLYSATHRAAASVARAEARRSAREQKASIMNEVLSSEEETVDWIRVRPLLDEAMRQISDSDRDAILLRYFERRPFAAIGAVLHLNEDTARMRVERALKKLHAQLVRRGITSTASALAIILTNQSVASAPIGLLATVISSAVAVSSNASTAAAATWLSMSTTKAIITTVAILATGSTIYQIRETHHAEATLVSERNDMARRLDFEERQAKELRKRIAALNSRRPEHVASKGSPISSPSLDRQARMQNLEYRKLQATTLRGQLDVRYASLFKAIGLNSGQLDQFKNLLVEKQMATTDAASAAREQGITSTTDPQGWAQAIREAADSIDGQIKSAIGADAYNQFQQYDQTLPERAVVSQLQQALSYTASPLSDDQANQLIQIFQNAITSPTNTFDITVTTNTGLTVVDGRPYTVTDQALGMAQTVLSAEQVQALRQLQSQQQAQRQMIRLIGGRPPP